MAESLSDRFTGGVFWGLAERFLSQLLHISCGVYVARTLGPDQMGLLGLIAVFAGLARTVTDFNFSTAIIQKLSLDEDDLPTAFWTNLGIGGLLSLAFFLASQGIAVFYSRDELVPLVRLFSCTFMLGALSATHVASLSREMRFKAVSVCESVAGIVRALLAVTLVICGGGVESVVLAMLVANVIKVASLWYMSVWRVRLVFSAASFRSMFAFGIQMTGENILMYVAMNVDNLLIGKLLGSKALGLYSRSYSLMRMPIGMFGDAIKKALLPTLSKIQSDDARAGQAVLKVSRWIALAAFPVMVGLSVISGPLVLLLFGEKWRELIPVLRWMFLIGAPYAILTINGTICRAKGRADIALRLALWRAFLAVGLFWFGCRLFGIMGVVMANALLLFGSWIPNHYIALRLVKVPLSRQLKNLASAALVSLTVGAAAWIALFCASQWATYLLQVLLSSLAGFLVFLWSMVHYRPRTWREMGELIAARTKGNRAANWTLSGFGLI